MIFNQGGSINFEIEPKELRWLIGFTVFVILITSIPYLLGFFSQGEDWRFSGFVLGVEDGNSYIAKMHSGAYGAWLFRTPYTAIEQSGIVAFLPYILLGKMASSPGLHIQLVVLFHIFRVVANILVIYIIYKFISLFVNSKEIKRFGLFLVAFGGGLGWVLVIGGKTNWMGSLPLEFYSPETFGFLELYSLPHLSLSRATALGTVFVYLCYMISMELFSDKDVGTDIFPLRNILIMSLFWLVTAIVQPITGGLLGIVIGSHLFMVVIICKIREGYLKPIFWKKWWGLIRNVGYSSILPAIYLLYLAFMYNLDIFLKTWSRQNVIESPHPLHYLLAFGLTFPFIYAGAKYILKTHPVKGSFLTTWIAIFPILVYAPVNIQRRLSEGIWVVVVTLVLIALEKVKYRSERESDNGIFSKTHYEKIKIPLYLLFPSSIIILSSGILAAINPKTPVFQSTNEIDAYRYLAEYADTNEVVLASYKTSNAIPAWAPVRAIVGHGPESVNLDNTNPRINAFFQLSTSHKERRSLLNEFDVSYVFWGPEERSHGEFDLDEAEYLHDIYHDEVFSIFEVR